MLRLISMALSAVLAAGAAAAQTATRLGRTGRCD